MEFIPYPSSSHAPPRDANSGGTPGPPALRRKHGNFLAGLLLAYALVAAVAPAAVVFDTAGSASYSYSAAGGTPEPPTPLGSLPPASELDSVSPNIAIVHYAHFEPDNLVFGLGTSGAGEGTIVWHFQTSLGLEFAADVAVSVGTGVDGSKGFIRADYSFDKLEWTPWGDNGGAPDQPLNPTVVAGAAGRTDLYVRFTIQSYDVPGRAVVAWGEAAVSTCLEGQAGQPPHSVMTRSLRADRPALPLPLSRQGPAGFPRFSKI